MKSLKFAGVLLFSSMGLWAQAGSTAAAPLPTAPSSATTDPLPPANPKFFTASSPTEDTVNAFLHAIWGYDTDRVYRVMAIMKTASPGVSKVVVFVTSKTPGAQMQTLQLYVLPDGKHAISDNLFSFGAKPFAEDRLKMQEHADGPWHGASSKDLELVEFADMQCPHCKVAQETMKNLVRDFPQAHIVYQNFPLTEIHPFAAKAAAYGNCVAKTSNDAFFVYLDDVFAHQEALNDQAGNDTLNAAVTKAGLDPKAVATCAASPEEQKHIQDQIAFANDVGVTETPMLSVNGHLMPIGDVPYETLKQVITFQAQQDGVSLK